MHNPSPNTPPLPSGLNGQSQPAQESPKGVKTIPSTLTISGSDERTYADATATPWSAPQLLHRLAAQWRAPKQAQSGVAWEHDPLARQRDEEENPRERTIIHFVTPPGDESAVEDTPKGNYLKLIEENYPLRAQWLRDFYNHSVLPLLARYRDVVREEWEKLDGFNREVERRNAEAEARRAELEAERDQKIRPYQSAILALDKPLEAAHSKAAHRASRAGGYYDPQHPSPKAVLRHNMRPSEVIAGEYGIPYTPGDAAWRLPKWFLWILTGGTGVVVGLSLAIVGTFVDADAIGDNPLVVAFAVMVGFIVTAGGGWAVRHFCRAATERYYIALYHERSALYWIPSLLMAIIVSATIKRYHHWHGRRD